MIWTS